jgi:dipeptidyl aminopeptidase/acylaminoacyl peptidase
VVAVALVFIAFLRAGDVWTQSGDGGSATNVTRSGGRVEDFRFSPTGEYLAFAKRIRRAEERPVCSIVVMRTASRRVLREFTPSEGWLDIDKWLGPRLIYHSSAAMEVNGVFEYDVSTDARRALDLELGSIAMDSDASPDGRLTAFVDNDGVGATFESRVHVRDARTGDDVVHARKRSAMAPAISPDARAVAFLEVVDGTAGMTNGRDRVWVTRLGRETTLIYDGPVQAKGGGSALTWSPDSSRLAMNFGGRTTILDPGRVTPGRQLSGAAACWLDPAHLIVATPAGIARIAIESGESRPVAAAASRPQCLPAAPPGP